MIIAFVSNLSNLLCGSFYQRRSVCVSECLEWGLYLNRHNFFLIWQTILWAFCIWSEKIVHHKSCECLENMYMKAMIPLQFVPRGIVHLYASRVRSLSRKEQIRMFLWSADFETVSTINNMGARRRPMQWYHGVQIVCTNSYQFIGRLRVLTLLNTSVFIMLYGHKPKQG